MKTVSIPRANLGNTEKHKKEENLIQLYFQCLAITTVRFWNIVFQYFFPITLLQSLDNISFFYFFI